MLSLASGIGFVLVGLGLLLRVFGVTPLSTPERHVDWLSKYGKPVKWLAPLMIALGIFNIARSAAVFTQNAAEDERMSHEIAAQLSQGLPRRLSRSVIFESVTAERATVTFKYKLEYPPSSVREAAGARAIIESVLLERFCSRESLRQLMLQIPGRALLVFDDGTKFSEFSFSDVFEHCPQP